MMIDWETKLAPQGWTTTAKVCGRWATTRDALVSSLVTPLAGDGDGTMHRTIRDTLFGELTAQYGICPVCLGAVETGEVSCDCEREAEEAANV
jgi:hypothetical protein